MRRTIMHGRIERKRQLSDFILRDRTMVWRKRPGGAFTNRRDSGRITGSDTQLSDESDTDQGY